MLLLLGAVPALPPANTVCCHSSLVKLYLPVDSVCLCPHQQGQDHGQQDWSWSVVEQGWRCPPLSSYHWNWLMQVSSQLSPMCGVWCALCCVCYGALALEKGRGGASCVRLRAP